jgi:hypothetical protein
MPTWTEFPDHQKGPYAFRVVRTPAKGTLTGLITCTNVSGCPTHFTKNRTIPCEGQDNCQACAAGISWRWHGYVSCILSPGLEHVLFEFTAAASDTFKTYFAMNGTMRACKFTAHRPSGKTNGRIAIACTRMDEQTLRIPEPPDLRRLLCHLWNIPYTMVDDDEIHRPPFRHVGVAPDHDDGRNRP